MAANRDKVKFGSASDLLVGICRSSPSATHVRICRRSLATAELHLLRRLNFVHHRLTETKGKERESEAREKWQPPPHFAVSPPGNSRRAIASPSSFLRPSPSPLCTSLLASPSIFREGRSENEKWLFLF
ncbi:hypothetical protein TIFTF001_026120 [Ficus carica]|uniref:Uncharacterized protein n=1 Tax=Ficus carica TaxID=3494 RepID=A0AA88B1T9_FICCA|nr:hypothetical protein TIFTF001_026120 [Ficus carica]